jgi:hypothetical protein
MSSYKKLSKADVTNVPYAANKQWNFTYSSSLNDSYMVVYKGKKETFNITGSITTNGQYQSSIFSSINHLFYQSYSGSLLNTGSIMFNANTYQSASQQRPTGAYFDYNTNPLLIKNFPTGANAGIRVLSINQDIYGSKILPYSFRLSSSLYYIIDDGNGNLYDAKGEVDDYILTNYISQSYFVDAPPDLTHVGNIFYAHGLAIITNQAYTSSFPRMEQCSFYEFNGNKTPSTEFTFTSCSGEFATISVSDFPQTYCINNDYPITKISGPGDYIYSGSCSGNSNITASISFQNEHIICENEVRCIVKESEFSLSYNPTLVTGSYADGNLKGFATSASFQPYATAIGLYNDDNELLMVAKLGKPIMISPDTDMTFIVKYDT